MDIVFSGAGLLLLFPLCCIVAIAILLVMPGPIFFMQERAGLRKEIFQVIKFRTMKADKEAEKNFDVTRDAERLTKLGQFLRRTKIDEIPQLLNVFVGDMSLVGPRPTFYSQAKEYDAFQVRRLEMRPGMTGLAQVNGNISLPWEQRIAYDIWYIDHFSVWLDIKILAKTCLVVLFGEARFKNPPTTMG